MWFNEKTTKIFQKLKILGLIIIFFTLIFCFSDSFASSWGLQTNSWNLNKLNLEISDSKIWIWESFTLKASLELWDQNDIWDINIAWLEKFNLLWNSSSIRMQTINWETKWIYDIEIKLQAIEKGNFEIWPVEIEHWDKKNISNKVLVEVWDKLNSWINSQNSNIQNNEDSNFMTDINDNIWQKDFNFNLYFWFFLILGFFLLFYYLLKHYFSLNETKKEEIIQEKIVEVSKKDYFLDKLKSIKKEKETLNKWDFLAKINDLIREIFEHIWVSNARTKTLKEISKNTKTDENLLKILKETYFEQFKNKDLDLDKDEILEKLKQIINKMS